MHETEHEVQRPEPPRIAMLIGVSGVGKTSALERVLCALAEARESRTHSSEETDVNASDEQINGVSSSAQAYSADQDQ